MYKIKGSIDKFILIQLLFKFKFEQSVFQK